MILFWNADMLGTTMHNFVPSKAHEFRITRNRLGVQSRQGSPPSLLAVATNSTIGSGI
jgi:hypothetical protein